MKLRLFCLLLLLLLFPRLEAQENSADPQVFDPQPAAGPVGADAAPEGAAPTDAEGPPSAGAGASGSDAAEDAALEEPLPPVKETPEGMDIRTSSFAELAAWCKQLGLSEGGTKDELANRLRDFYKLPRPGSEAPSGKRVITIQSARSTEYFTLDVVDEDYARLKGGVVVTLKDGDAVHTISAGEILYNRTRNLISASGGVSYEKVDGDKTESFKGDSIIVNLDDWSSIFTNGQSEKAVSSSNTVYRFEGTVLSRDSEESTVLSKARITNAKTEEPYWSLNASKMWLLSGSDWAVANVVLKVGEIPVLYLPFFYLPSEEIVFHPTVGYRSREGSFFQTTTYLMGRTKATEQTEASFINMFGNDSNTAKERKGLFLRSSGKKTVDPNDTRLSLLIDAYANLGAYFGAELSLPRKGILGAMDVSAGIGLTRNIYSNSSGYTPFFNGEDEWNKDNYFFSAKVPFRYRFKTSGSLSGKYGSLNWTLPFYSDPYVDSDFMTRSEQLDWLKILKGTALEEETTTSTTSDLSSYSWSLSSSFNPKVAILSPYVSSLSISSLSSTLAFNKGSSAKTPAPAPNRMFFYPYKWTMFSISTSLAGTPLSLGAVASSSSSTPAADQDFLQGIGTPRSPWEKPEDKEDSSAGAAAPVADKLVPPVLAQRWTLPASASTRFSIDYRLAPTAASELQFASSKWKEPEDIDWGESDSILTNARGDGSLGFTLSQSRGLYTTSLRFSGTGAWQDYTYLNDETYTTQKAKNDVMLRAYQQTNFSTSFEYTGNVKPFYMSPVWGSTNFQYSVRGLMLKNAFDKAKWDASLVGASGATDQTEGKPEWDLTYGDWVKEKIDTHQFAANINASIRDLTQSLTLSADLPPREASISGSATMRAWLTETSIRGKFYNSLVWDAIKLDDYRRIDSLLKDDENPNGRKRTYDPLYFTETIRWLAPGGSFFGGASGATYSGQQYAIYDPELAEWTNLTSTFNLAAFSAVYTMLRSKTYNLESTGWVQSTDKEKINPNSLRFGYSKSYRKDSLWKNRLAFSVNTSSSLSFDLQRYTYSRFSFSLGFTLGISEFLDFSLSANSENSVIYRYIQDWPMFQTGVTLNGEKNVFIDLFNSFRFDDEERRKASGFKLKSFQLNFVHHLGDWDATLGMVLSPYLDSKSNPPVYKFNNQISFLVKWIPISEIKTEVYYDKQKNEDNPLTFK
jgi:lipopolysaccharide assembly outer membrane protein LptD (OstA)